MSKDAILYGIIGLLLGAMLTVFVARSAVNNNNGQMMSMMGMQRQGQFRGSEEMFEMMDHGMTMDDMVESLRNKSGDDFDKEFTNLMIVHHQGAIDMANLAKVSAKHPEIKNLADDIIVAQTKEIEMMRDWQKLWSY